MVATVDKELRRARIREVVDAIKAQGLTQVAICDELDVTPQAMTGWLKTGNIENRNAVKLATMGGFSPTFLIFDRAANSDETDGWSDILAVKTAAALGDGAVPDEYAETHKLKFRAESLRRKGLHHRKLCVVYGRGESMLPRIRPGDAILFDTGDTAPKDETLFVVSYASRDEGGLVVKQLLDIGGKWHLQGLNPDDPKWRKPRPIDDQRDFKIHGRVRWIGSWED